MNIYPRPLFMWNAPHINCSDGKGRDKNLNVQGICEEFSKKVLSRCKITINFAYNKPQKPTYMDENTRNIITTIATIIAIVCAVLNCIVTAISLCADN